MQVHYDELSDVKRYLDNNRRVSVEEHEAQFHSYMVSLRQCREIGPETRMLEVGTGTGWFPLLCALKGLNCKGLDISPALVEHGRQLGRQYGVELDIGIGNLEDYDLGSSAYDVIIASNIFEHVERWRDGLRTIFRALRPGGAMFFESSNKFSLRSGEYWLPLYGWLPNAVRYRLRMAVHGADIMKLGIDFNQFTYPQLRREFRSLGFSRIYDRVDLADPERVSAGWKKWVVLAAQRNRVSKTVSLAFADVTRFVCIK